MEILKVPVLISVPEVESYLEGKALCVKLHVLHASLSTLREIRKKTLLESKKCDYHYYKTKTSISIFF